MPVVVATTVSSVVFCHVPYIYSTEPDESGRPHSRVAEFSRLHVSSELCQVYLARESDQQQRQREYLPMVSVISLGKKKKKSLSNLSDGHFFCFSHSTFVNPSKRKQIKNRVLDLTETITVEFDQCQNVNSSFFSLSLFLSLFLSLVENRLAWHKLGYSVIPPFPYYHYHRPKFIFIFI